MKQEYFHIVAILVVMVWGMTFISTKILIGHGLSPQDIFFFRFLLAYIGIWVVSPRQFFAQTLKDELYLFGAGISGGSLFFFLQNMALEITQVSNVSFIICTSPLLTMILTVIFFRVEKITKGFIYGLLGVGLVVFNGGIILKISPLGDLLSLLASLLWDFYSIITQQVSSKYSPLFIIRKIFFYGIITILPTFLLRPIKLELSVLLDSAVLTNLLFLGIIASLVCYLLWNIVLRQLGTIRASNYLYLNPLATMVGAMCFLHERITPFALVGIRLVLLGVYKETNSSVKGKK